MKIILAVSFAFVFMFVACKKENVANKPQENTIKTLTFDELYSNTLDMPKGKVAVEGLCVHVCKHSGKKIFIVGADPNSKLQIYAGEGLAGFPPDLEGSKVRVVGVLEEEKIDMKAALDMENELLADEKKEDKPTGGSCVVEDEMKQIKDLKAKIQKSPKGYFSLYSMTSAEYKKI
jgi:hypothetical protein